VHFLMSCVSLISARLAASVTGLQLTYTTVPNSCRSCTVSLSRPALRIGDWG